MILPGQVVGPGFTGRPARMAPEDFEIWKRWFPTVREGTVRILFDVGVGEGRTIPANTEPAFEFMWLRNTQKRIDAVLEREDEFWIVELRFAAQTSAIGRVLTYKRLWDKDSLKIDPRPSVAFIVTNAEEPDVRETAEALGIRYVVI